MSFHSLDFVVFLAIVWGLYWCLGMRWQNRLLVPVSWLFYGYIHPWFLIPFLATTLVDYFVAIGLESSHLNRRLLVAASVCSNIGLLGVFKYYDFFAVNVSGLLATLHVHVSVPVLEVILPAGISFYTFQSIGYVVDVYRGHVRACRNPIDYALFVAFFPLLVAGPIQRAGDFLVQIQRPRALDPGRFLSALYLLIWGMFKKVVIADSVAITANKIFLSKDLSFPILWVGVFAFCIQIYADFSAYTDIARGTARLFGFELSPNFNHPYIAQSPGDFWRRWHMSLSTWIRDYIFIPLGGSRGSSTRTAVNLTIVFLLTGLWHGASWNFVLWGLYYATLTILYRLAARLFPERITGRWEMIAGRVILMFALTNLGWLIFRERDLAQLARDLMLSPTAASVLEWRVAVYIGMLTLIYSLPLWIHALWDLKLRETLALQERTVLLWVSPLVATILFTGILLLRSDISGDFIYFQF
jgi:D-alanyl-lipoteichoic acid acyltransferase DltB (MBOAT superfamily)